MTIRDLTTRLRAYLTRDDTAAWLASPAGCCECGTGGPYYDGSDGPAVTRYAYVGATDVGRSSTAIDWTSCSRHRLDWIYPAVDLREDRVITSRDLDALHKAVTSW